MGVKRKIGLLLLTGMGAALLLIPFLRTGTAASAPEYPSCNSLGVQRFPERERAPAFSLRSLNGGQVSLSDFKGKPVLITFWGTWCESCKEELPVLEKFSVGKRDQLAILLIAIDGERERTVQKIVTRNKITLPVLLLLKENVMDQYGVRGWIPLTFLVDQEGMLVGKIVGQRDWSTPEAWSCLKDLFKLR
jgi:peroxiredoxin